MDSIRIKNFRSFVDSGEISINKVNVLLGKNSSGKSSFLNLFPMFKESAKNELRSPFMWFSEGLYDFGSYKNARSRYIKGKEPIVFEFSWTALKEKKGEQCDECSLYDRQWLGFLNSSKYKLAISVNNDGKGDYLEEVILEGNKHYAKVSCAKDRTLTFCLDGKVLDTKVAVWDYNTKGILPNICFKSKYYPTRSVKKLINSLIPEDPQVSLKNADYEKLYNIAEIEPSAIYSYYEQNKGDNPFMDYIVRAHRVDSEEFLNYCNDICLSLVVSSLRYADRYISSSFEETSYMLPVRYAFGRYIRNKNLAVENVDPSGANVMEFLLSLTKKELESFNNLVERVLCVTVSVETEDKKGSSDENRSIFVVSKQGRDNIVDVGYGYTQILPIIAVLWNLARQKNSCEFPNIVIIEQPEVHLHPSLQGDVAKLIVEVVALAESNKSALQIFVETHSEAFVNRLGKYVRINSSNKKDGISPDDVSLLLFENKGSGTAITSTSYDKDGYIKRWPIGFMN